MLFVFVLFLLADVYAVSCVRPPERPVVPNITALSSTEVRITWCRVSSNKVEIDHYELFIDSKLDYSGIDVIYTAKRLKPWSWYEVKLRACGISPSSCSPFSRPVLVKTLRDNDNSTVIQSGVTIFKVVIAPTYMFMLGMLAGALALSFGLMWRYFQNADWSGEPVFELPQYMHIKEKQMKEDHNTYDPTFNLCSLLLQAQLLQCHSYGSANITDVSKACQVDNTGSKPLEIAKSPDEAQEKNFISLPFVSRSCDKLSSGEVTAESVPTLQFVNGKKDGKVFVESGVEGSSLTQINNESYWDNCVYEKQTVMSVSSNCNLQQLEPELSDTVPTVASAAVVEDLCPQTAGPPELESVIQLHATQTTSSTMQLELKHQAAEAEVKVSPALVVAIDNSNIYIGAQECASMINPSDRKRHVRVKLQNLVKILERERTKTRGFACGSSPPATEHVWEVYRRLGYTVDLEERRGKDEQRVDEGLHLCIYKALCELPAGVLVLATGDGTKGKSECDTSFPGCAASALQRGWGVEVYSWKHSLSAEWNKLAKRHPSMLKIHYLDKYVNNITFVDGKYGRKCLPVPDASQLLK